MVLQILGAVVVFAVTWWAVCWMFADSVRGAEWFAPDDLFADDPRDERDTEGLDR